MWINANERVPEPGIPVLVVDAWGNMAVAYVKRYEMSDGDWLHYWKLCVTGGHAEDDDCDNVTHWHPLPEPPKVDK